MFFSIAKQEVKEKYAMLDFQYFFLQPMDPGLPTLSVISKGKKFRSVQFALFVKVFDHGAVRVRIFLEKVQIFGMQFSCRASGRN